MIEGPQLRAAFSGVEQEIARLIGENLSYAEIGAQLELSPNTVRVYTTQMALKIDFGDKRRPPPRTAVYALVLHQRYVGTAITVAQTI